jgi:hypothetical protein
VRGGLISFLLLLLAGLAPGAARAAPGPFADWAAIVVAGDFHAAHTNNPTETFDNARRDVAVALERKGFQAANLRQFSVRPERYADTRPQQSELRPIYETLRELTGRARAGCLLYFTSHGAPQGVVLGDSVLPPGMLDQLITQTCGERPTVVIISACFSGVFVPVLAESNRMIVTAARRDRSSFGCSESNKYPYFDECVLKVLPGVKDFIALGPAVQGCVAQRETDEGLKPPSEPQVSVGAGLRPILPLMVFPPG